MGIIAESHPALSEFLRSTAGAQGKGMQAYLIYMAVRLIEMQRVLKPSGSIYLHCDATASHYLKVVMDCIFGKQNFRNEIVWGYAKPRPAKRMFVRNHDILLFYSKTDEAVFNPQRMPNLKGEFKLRKPIKRADGTVWQPKDKGVLAGSWWYDIPSFATRMTAKERCGYPTQKPIAMLKRIILASSNEGDLVLDPFCGCATACVAALDTGRKWIGIDLSPKAYDLIQMRFNKELGLISPKIIHRTDLPHLEGTLSKDIKHFLYGKQEGLCNGCEHYFHFRNMTKDHVVPTSKGGANSDDNLQLLCGACNSLKGNRKTMPELRAKLHQQGILRAA